VFTKQIVIEIYKYGETINLCKNLIVSVLSNIISIKLY